jgi:hypothetical protein
MSLLEKIENLQKKPEAIRRRILFCSVATIMFIIISIWVITLKYSTPTSEEDKDANIGPFRVLGELFKETVDVSVSGVKSGFDQVKRQFNARE